MKLVQPAQRHEPEVGEGAERGDVEVKGRVVVEGGSLERQFLRRDAQAQRHDRLVAIGRHHAVVPVEHRIP